MLSPPVELSEELSVAAVVQKILTFQAILLDSERSEPVDGSEQQQEQQQEQLVRVDSSHGAQAEAIQHKDMAQLLAERIATVVKAWRASPDPRRVRELHKLIAQPDPDPQRVKQLLFDVPLLVTQTVAEAAPERQILPLHRAVRSMHTEIVREVLNALERLPAEEKTRTLDAQVTKVFDQKG